MPSSLPIEIIDYILGHLDDEPPALLACCLLSSSWRTCAQPHLFRSIDICTEPTTSLLAAALTAAPHLAAHIRAVHAPICLDDNARAVLAHGPFHRVTALALSDAELSPVLTGDDVPVTRLASAFPGVRALTIEHAFFRSLPILARLLSVFPDATCLRLRRLEVEEETPQTVERHTPPLALTTLVLEDCAPCLTALWMGDGALLLRRLVVHDFVDGFSGEHYAALAARAADTLAELEIEIHRMEHLAAFAREYTARAGTLRSLRLRVRAEDPDDGLVHAVRLARDIAPEEHMARITLDIMGRRRLHMWSAVRDAPFVWTCVDLYNGGRVYEGREALERLGIK